MPFSAISVTYQWWKYRRKHTYNIQYSCCVHILVGGMYYASHPFLYLQFNALGSWCGMFLWCSVVRSFFSVVCLQQLNFTALGLNGQVQCASWWSSLLKRRSKMAFAYTLKKVNKYNNIVNIHCMFVKGKSVINGSRCNNLLGKPIAKLYLGNFCCFLKSGFLLFGRTVKVKGKM